MSSFLTSSKPHMVLSRMGKQNKNIYSPAGTWGPASPSAGRAQISAALSRLLAVFLARYPPGQWRDHWVVAGMMTVWKQKIALEKKKIIRVEAELNKWQVDKAQVQITLTHHDTYTSTFLWNFWLLTHTKTTGTNMHKTLPYIFPAVHPLLTSFNLVS